MIVKVLVWGLLNYGLMNIIVFSSLFSSVRNLFTKFPFLYELLTCPMCFATWCGFFTGFFIWSPLHQLYGLPVEISWFFDGILSSGLVWIINTIVEFFEENRLK